MGNGEDINSNQYQFDSRFTEFCYRCIAFSLEIPAPYPYPLGTTKVQIELENKFLDFRDIVNDISSKDSRAIAFDIYDFDVKKGGILSNPSLMDQVYYKIMLPDDTEENFERMYAQYISLISPANDKKKEKLVKKFRSLFPKILGIYILIGRMEYFEKYLGNNYGMKFIAANGIPTQHELTARSSNQSFYFNPITFILNVDGKLNEGKTHLVSEHLKKQCIEFFRESFESTLNRLAKEFMRTVPNTDKPKEVDFVSLKSIDIDGVDIKREPVDENTLIALFAQLLKKKQQDLPIYGLQSNGIFDGAFTYIDEDIRSNRDLLKLEFKVNLKKLLEDFDSPNSPKEFNECDLVIVWDDSITSTQQQDWRVVSTESARTSAVSRSQCPNWVETLLKDKDQVYKPIIVLKDWVKEFDSSYE